MHRGISAPWIALLLIGLAAGPGSAQMLLTGRLLAARQDRSAETVPLTAVYVYASLPGGASESLGFRTWEMHPAGWFRLSGSSGCYTALFAGPAHFLRPVVLTNLHLGDGETIDRTVRACFDLASFHEGGWDPRPAREYYQVFTARSRSVTHVGFKLAHDGVDGAGPGQQDLLVSIHRCGEGPPPSWEQVGPAMPVLDVDCGGPKSYAWSAGWVSGEVPTRRGEPYAVRIRARDPGGSFQAFWRETGGAPRCYRVGEGGGELIAREIWLSVAGDGDGLLIPYAKRVHREFAELTRFASRWSQTYIARGRGLAGVILCAAVSGVQPPLSRQRVRLRVRRGGPDGPPVGAAKIAAGSGNYTGDASWGTFGAAFAPGEVDLVPGETYALEIESIESHHTLHDYVNIKGMASDNRPGFNPYRKAPG
ncbi:MAG: hypothetical protein JXA90_16685, partial [Planctomycetes bacterium]|nr:hypothetical protein [Planctomycetota bacterium]